MNTLHVLYDTLQFRLYYCDTDYHDHIDTVKFEINLKIFGGTPIKGKSFSTDEY